MNEAIALAIKGGYDAHFDRPIGIKDWRTCVLKPEFWQALGRALGWKSWKLVAMDYFRNTMDEWAVLDEEKFWKELLTPQQ
jgi:hypothetical protein